MGSEDHIASKTLQAWSASPIAMVMGSVYLEMEMGVVAWSSGHRSPELYAGHPSLAYMWYYIYIYIDYVWLKQW